MNIPDHYTTEAKHGKFASNKAESGTYFYQV